MSVAKSLRTPEELDRLGLEIQTQRIEPTLRPEDDNKFVAIDVDSGDFEVDPDDYSAIMRLRARHPLGELWLGRVGRPATYQSRRPQ